jgi:hypothetical protein
MLAYGLTILSQAGGLNKPNIKVIKLKPAFMDNTLDENIIYSRLAY